MRKVYRSIRIAAALAVAILSLAVTLPESVGNPVPRNHIVQIKGLKFVPKEVAVRPGDTVTWVNKDFVPHTATAYGKGWDSGLLKADGRWKMVVRKGQKEKYFCKYHPTMTGRLRILAK